ncbi:glycosyl transferase, partial [Rhodococcus erythropolis]
MTGAINASDGSSFDAETVNSGAVVPEPAASAEIPQHRLRVGMFGFVVLGVLAIASVLMVLFAVPMNTRYWGIFENFLDLDVYRHGGSVVVQGLPLYDGPVLQGMMFTYTPFAALLFTVWA